MGDSAPCHSSAAVHGGEDGAGGLSFLDSQRVTIPSHERVLPDQANPPPATQPPGPAARKPASRLLVLYACIGFILITSIEGTIVATVMPEIVGDLGGFDLFS